MKTKTEEIVETKKTNFQYIIHKGYALVKLTGRNTVVQAYTEKEFNNNIGKRNNQFFKVKQGKTRYIALKDYYDRYVLGDFGYKFGKKQFAESLSDAVTEINNGEPVLITQHAQIDGFLWLDDEPYRRSYVIDIYNLKESEVERIKKNPRITLLNTKFTQTKIGYNLSDNTWKEVKKALKTKTSSSYSHWKLLSWIKKQLKIDDETSYNIEIEEQDYYDDY